jgi:hypothetical protein
MNSSHSPLLHIKSVLELGECPFEYESLPVSIYPHWITVLSTIRVKMLFPIPSSANSRDIAPSWCNDTLLDRVFTFQNPGHLPRSLLKPDIEKTINQLYHEAGRRWIKTNLTFIRSLRQETTPAPANWTTQICVQSAIKFETPKQKRRIAPPNPNWPTQNPHTPGHRSPFRGSPSGSAESNGGYPRSSSYQPYKAEFSSRTQQPTMIARTRETRHPQHRLYKLDPVMLHQ